MCCDDCGYTFLDHKRNEKIIKLQIPQVTEIKKKIRTKWKEYPDRMSPNRIEGGHTPEENKSLVRSLK
jgi:hypothetical protein